MSLFSGSSRGFGEGTSLWLPWPGLWISGFGGPDDVPWGGVARPGSRDRPLYASLSLWGLILFGDIDFTLIEVVRVEACWSSGGLEALRLRAVEI